MIEIWHNPRCSKSRSTLALLEVAGKDLVVRRYLEDPPTEAELTEALIKLELSAQQFIRTCEPVYAELGLEIANEATLIAAMSNHPILIQRPIVISGARAIIGRPPKNVELLL